MPWLIYFGSLFQVHLCMSLLSLELVNKILIFFSILMPSMWGFTEGEDRGSGPPQENHAITSCHHWPTSKMLLKWRLAGGQMVANLEYWYGPPLPSVKEKVNKQCLLDTSRTVRKIGKLMCSNQLT